MTRFWRLGVFVVFLIPMICCGGDSSTDDESRPTLRPTFTIMDAIVGMEGDGPAAG